MQTAFMIACALINAFYTYRIRSALLEEKRDPIMSKWWTYEATAGLVGASLSMCFCVILAILANLK